MSVKFLVPSLSLLLCVVLGSCDPLLPGTTIDDYDVWYYSAEGYVYSEGSVKPAAISILHGITDIDGWTIDTGSVGARWKSRTFRRLKNLARLEIGFEAAIENGSSGYIRMHIHLNGELHRSLRVPTGSGGCHVEAVIGDLDAYSVSYRGNWTTGGHPPIDDQIYHVGDSAVIKNNEGNLQKIGSRLVGWNTQADGYGQAWNFGDIMTMPDGNVVLYAQWERLGDEE